MIESRAAFDAMYGYKTLIKGNHDTDKIASLDWAHVCELLEIKDRGIDLVLCHYPMMTWNNAREDALHLFGHVHTNWKGSNAAINMAVELWDYQPADIQQIYNTSHKLPVHEPWRLAEPGMI